MKIVEFWTIVNEAGESVGTQPGEDGHFYPLGVDRMMNLTENDANKYAQWSREHCDGNRIKVYPAKATITLVKQDSPPSVRDELMGHLEAIEAATAGYNKNSLPDRLDAFKKFLDQRQWVDWKNI